MKDLTKGGLGFNLNGEAPSNFYFDEDVQWCIMLDVYNTCLDDFKWNIENTNEMSILNEYQFKMILSDNVIDYLNIFSFMYICIRKGLTEEAKGFKKLSLDLAEAEYDLFGKNDNVFNPNDGIEFHSYMDNRYETLIDSVKTDIEFDLDILPNMSEEDIEDFLNDLFNGLDDNDDND